MRHGYAPLNICFLSGICSLDIIVFISCIHIVHFPAILNSHFEFEHQKTAA